MSDNPLLAKIKLPGRILQLPSRGKLYTTELTGCPDGEVHVRPMSALDEISMKNPDLLFSGKAISEVLPHCVPEIKEPENLFGKDVDALMLFLRIVTYGNFFEIELRHDCKDAKNHSYTIDLEKILARMKYLDPTTVEKITTLILPNDQVVVLQPLRYKHIIEVLQQNQTKKEFTAEDIKNNLIRNTMSLILSVDGVTDRNMIQEWVRDLPATYSNRLAERVNEINDWGPQLEEEIVCKDCGGTMSVDIPINPMTFFTE